MVQAKFDLSIALALSAWPALTLAVQSSWGGPESSAKRDWFAGAISDLIAATPDADVDFLEEFLLQVMNDEFDAVLEDGSAEEVAIRILALQKSTSQGNFEVVNEMFKFWEERESRGESVKFLEGVEEQDETDSDSDDMDQEEEDEGNDEADVEMEDAPELVKIPKEKPSPEVDEDGFTKVITRKKR